MNWWKKFLSDILAMVKQFGWPTFFMILSSEDLRWNKLISITRKLNKINLPEDDINKLSYHERCHILNSNPVLIVATFSAVFNFFWKELSYHFRFDTWHIHSFLWALNTPILTASNKEEYVAFVDTIAHVSPPGRNENLELY